MRERFSLANESDRGQQERERDDLAFYAGNQWPADVINQRRGQQAVSGMPQVPARPTLIINKIREPVRQTLNQERQADLGVEIIPTDDFGDLGITIDATEIALREGLVRRIQRESHAADARTWAFARAVQAGRGYYQVLTRFLPGKSWDQEVYVDRIYNQAGVLGDPSRTKPDGSDSEFWFVGQWLLSDKFLAEYPELDDGSKNPLAGYSDDDLMGLCESYPDWYRAEGGGETKLYAVRVQDYWYIDRDSRTLVILSDGSTAWEDELPKESGKKGKAIPPDGLKIVDRRTVVEKQIKWCKVAGGYMKLEETDWPCDCMPIVQVLGEELHPYDEEKRIEGMVRSARDAQMGENYMISKFVETVGLTPISPLQVDPDAIDGYEAWYAVANTRTLPYLPSRTYDDQGRQLKEPHRPAADPNMLPMAQGIALFDQFIKSTTAVPDPTLGNVDPSLKSGKAIQATVANAAQSTSHFLDNFARAVQYEGQIENSLLYPIYGAKPGRLVRILTGSGDSQPLLVNPDPQAQQLQQQAKQVAMLTKDAHFNVTVKVSKSYDTRRQQEATTLGELISAEPMLMTWFGDLFFKNADTPGHLALSERAKAMLAPPVQALLAQQAQGGDAIPPVAMAKIQQLQQQLQMAEKVMQQLAEEAKGHQLDYQKAIDSEHVKQTAEIQRAQLDADKELKLAQMKNATSIEVARINAEAKMGVSSLESQEEAIALDQEHAHAAAQADLDRQQEQSMIAQQAAMAASQAQQAQPQQQTSGAPSADGAAGA